MWWSLLLTLALQLLKWLLSENGPLKPKDEEKLQEFFRTVEKARHRAQARGVILDEEYQ